MALLTSRLFSTGITGNYLLHMVNPNDPSQNPAGSSFKVNMNQVTNYISQNFTGITANSVTTSAITLNGVTYTSLGGGGFSGGTISGGTNFTGGITANTIVTNYISGNSANFTNITANTITANTISASTYYNLPGSSSGNCFDDFYTDNIHSCNDSGITFHDSYQSLGSESPGVLSRSFGNGNFAYGDYSHAEGESTRTSWRGFRISGITLGVITLDSSYGDITSKFHFGTLLIITGTHQGIYNYSSSDVIYSAPNTIITLSSINSLTLISQNITTSVGYINDLDNFDDLDAEIINEPNSHSEGRFTFAIGGSSHSEGGDTISIGGGSHAEGSETISIGVNSHAEGASFLEGNFISSISYGDNSHAEGGSITYGRGSHAEGVLTRSGWKGYRANFQSPNIYKINSSLYGNVLSFFSPSGGMIYVSLLSGEEPEILSYSAATFISGQTIIFLSTYKPLYYGNVYISDLNTIHTNNSFNYLSQVSSNHSEGYFSKAVGNYSHSEGLKSITYSDCSHAEGGFFLGGSIYNGGITFSVGSHAEGNETKTYGSNSHAEGIETIAGWKGFRITGITNGVINLTYYTNVSSEFNPTGGYIITNENEVYEYSACTFSLGITKIFLNQNINVTNNNIYISDIENPNSDLAILVLKETDGLSNYIGSQHAEGYKSKSLGLYSHAEGEKTISAGIGSHSEGLETIAIGKYSHSEGYITKAIGEGSNVTGGRNSSSGDYSFIGGGTQNTIMVKSDNSSILGGEENEIFSVSKQSSIIGGTENIIKTGVTSSVIVGGKSNIVDKDVLRSVVIGGTGLIAKNSDTVYVPNLEVYDEFRIVNPYVPTGSTDPTGTNGQISWNGDTFYVKTTLGWGKVTLNTSW